MAASLGLDRIVVASKTPRSGEYATIQLAVNAAAALTPTAAAPMLVMSTPGTYTANVTLASNVYLAAFGVFGVSQFAGPVIIAGNLIWAPTDGAVSIGTGISGITVTGTTSIDTTGGTASPALFFATEARLVGAVAWTGRGGANDAISMTRVSSGALSIDDANAILSGYGCTGAIAVTNATVTAQLGTTVTGNVTLSGTSTYLQDSGTILGTVTANNGTSAELRGMGQIGGLAFAGTGAINRDEINGSTGAQAAGAGVVITFAVPFKDANFKVSLTQTAGAAAIPPLVTAYAATGFTMTVPVGGGTWDYKVQHD